MNFRSDTDMFVILLIASTFTQGLTMVSSGKDFVTAFPENLGYFYPYDSYRGLRITALHNTMVTVSFNNTQQQQSLHSGQTATVDFPNTAEVYRLGPSTNSIRITSDKDIVVHSVSAINTTHGENVQTTVVQPITNLGTHYLISLPNQVVSGASERYSSFKLIIINAVDTRNTVTLVKRTSSASVQEQQEYIIPPYQLVQLQANASLLRVDSSNKVAVILTHPCLENTTSCECNMIMNQILPTEFQGQNFVVPLFSVISQSCLLMTSSDMSTSVSCGDNHLEPISSAVWSLSSQTQSQYLTALGNVSLTLVNLGVFIELIPENMFAACYLLHFYSNTSGTKRAIVIAETNSTANVHIQNRMVAPEWTAIPNSPYSSGKIMLTDSTTVIWHSSSKIAVYMMERIGMTVYGGQAIPINDKPDEFGCVLIPGEYEVGNEPLSWARSLALCRAPPTPPTPTTPTTPEKYLACPTRKDIQTDLSENINTTQNGEGWIGLRRSLMTTDWYWQNRTQNGSLVNYFNWADGHPYDSYNGLCASLSLDRNDKFKWKSARCCERKLPICYKTPIYFFSMP